MKRSNFNKFGVLTLVMMLAFGTMGVAYSKWSDTITVNGNVSTGNVLVGIRAPFTPDPPPDEVGTGNVLVGTKDPRVVPFTTAPATLTTVTPDKNVGALGISQVGPIIFHAPNCNGFGGQDKDYYESIAVNITNAYPFYTPQINFIVSSYGTVPVKIDTAVLSNINDPNNMLGNMVWYWQWFETTTPIPPATTPPPQTNHYGHGTVAQLGAELHGVQIDQCQQLYVLLTPVFLLGTPEGSNVSFTFTLTGLEWWRIT